MIWLVTLLPSGGSRLSIFRGLGCLLLSNDFMYLGWMVPGSKGFGFRVCKVGLGMGVAQK